MYIISVHIRSYLGELITRYDLRKDCVGDKGQREAGDRETTAHERHDG